MSSSSMLILKDRSQLALLVVTIVLLASNVFLIIQNIQLRQTVEKSKLFVTEEGYRFSDLKIKGLDGNQDTIEFSVERPSTLLFVFNTACEYCLQQYPYWKELVSGLDMQRWRVVALTSEDDVENIKKHLQENELDNVKAGSIAREDIQKARLRYTPMTLVIDSKGEVKKVWAGLWKKGFDLPQ